MWFDQCDIHSRIERKICIIFDKNYEYNTIKHQNKFIHQNT